MRQDCVWLGKVRPGKVRRNLEAQEWQAEMREVGR